MKVDVSDDKTWHALGDPEMKCYMPGVPRATYMPFPFQIVQGTSPYILIAYEFTSATRIIRMDWKQEAPTDSWMGWSRGRWEGDTLVVDVTGQREETWFDRAGNYHSDALHVVERYTPASPYHLMYEATIEDPKVFTRPWKIRFPLYRRMEKNVQLLEFKCVPFTEELLFGKFRKPDGGDEMRFPFCRLIAGLASFPPLRRVIPASGRRPSRGQRQRGTPRRRRPGAILICKACGTMPRARRCNGRPISAKGCAQRRGSGGVPVSRSPTGCRAIGVTAAMPPTSTGLITSIGWMRGA